MGVVVIIKNTSSVTPSDPSFNGNLYLSEFDQTLGYVVPTVHFYRCSSGRSISTLASNLKHSLSRALVPFYPLAARLSSAADGRLAIHCNAAGALFFEAECEARIDDFGDFSPREEFNHLTPPVDFTAPIHDRPLFSVQLTAFRCGGFSLGFMISHAVADGLSAFRFIHEWARLARGEPMDLVPVHDRTLLLLKESDTECLRHDDQAVRHHHHHHAELDPPPVLIGQTVTAEDEKMKKTAVAIFHLSKPQVEKLKKIANEGRAVGGGDKGGDRDRVYSRYEVVVAHVWRCTCIARGHDMEQETALGFEVDFRNRIRPPLPAAYFGNAIIRVVARGRFRELRSNPLSYAAGKVREAIEKVEGEYVWSAADKARKSQDRFLLRGDNGPDFGNPNVSGTSWLNLPIYGLDFGWGKEAGIGLGTGASDGLNLILPSRNGDGSVVVATCLQVDHMEAFTNLLLATPTH